MIRYIINDLESSCDDPDEELKYVDIRNQIKKFEMFRNQIYY